MSDIHRQVLLQLEYLKSLVDYEENQRVFCKARGIPFTPSRRADENKYNYEMYQREVSRNGDVNLLVFTKYRNITLPFARRYMSADEREFNLLIHRCDNGSEILVKENR